MAKGDMTSTVGQTSSMVPGGPTGNMTGGAPNVNLAPTGGFQSIMQSLGRMAPAVQPNRAMMGSPMAGATPNSMGAGAMAPDPGFIQRLMSQLSMMGQQSSPQAINRPNTMMSDRNL